MITTVNLTELQKIIDSEHGNPHHVLGMHEIISQEAGVAQHSQGEQPDPEGNFLVVRAFIPDAKEMYVIDAENKKDEIKMKLIHMDGFFEVIIPNREKKYKYKLKINGHDGVSWETYDPYAFDIVLSEMDLYLFGEGTNYEIYNKLGAHPRVIDGVEGVLFAVWAPNAKRVSVIGDFCMWNGRRNQMRLIGNSGVWEIFIPGIKLCDKYKFEIKAHNGDIFEKSDPYANFMEHKPSTVSLVWDLNNYKWNDKSWIDKRLNENPLNKPINIYEVHLGSWKRVVADGNRYQSYMELADELIPYLKEMNYTHIEMLPIMEHPFDGSWGYQVTEYYAPTSRYGNPEEFMRFIDKCHQNDIGVILDWVPGHFPKDAHGLGRFDGSALYEHSDPRQGEHKEWGTYIFNFGRKEVKNYLVANALYWVEKFHIDGIRVDAVASMLYLDFCKNEGEWVPNQYGGHENIDAIEFIKHLNSIMFKRNPNILMIAEESTSWEGVSRNVDSGGLGFNLKWNMGWMNDMLFYVAKDFVHRKHHQNNLTFGMMYNHTENFVLVLSHDEVVHGKYSLLSKMPGDIWQKFAGLRGFLGFMYGHSGKKLLFMGGEFGQFIEWDEKRPLDWFLLEYEHHEKMLKFAHDLNKFYVSDEPLWCYDFSVDGFEWIQCDDIERSLLTFFRKGKSPKDITIFVCNFTPATIIDYKMGVPFKGKYKEVLSSDNVIYGGSGVLNEKIMVSEEVEWDKRENSISLKVPPLGVSIIKSVL